MIDFRDFYNIHKKEIEEYFINNNLDITKAEKLDHGNGMKDYLNKRQQFYDFCYMPKSDKKITCIDGDSPRSKCVLTIWFIDNKLIFEQNELTKEFLGK